MRSYPIAVAAALLLTLIGAAGRGAPLQAAEAITASRAGFNGAWLAEKATPQLRTEQGAEPPLLPEARKQFVAHRAALKAGDRSFDRTSWCASPGIPRLMFARHPFEIAVSPRRVAFLYSWSNWYRTVDMSGEAWEVEDEYSSVGVGMGHWENDVLVIHTTGLRSGIVLDREGLPHSEQLKLTERLRLLSDDKLEVRFRFEDPATYTQPWETVMTYRRQAVDSVREFICLDEIAQGRPGLIER